MSPRPLLVRCACFVAIAISVYYLTWRLLDSFNPHALALSIALWAAECYGLLTFVLHVLMVWDTRSLERRLDLRPEQNVAEAHLPRSGVERSVDVFIPTYNEPLSMLRKTALAARDLRGAHETWVLDDGRRSAVRAMCQELGIGYLTRDSNDHAKAGNLNAALPRTGGELIVVLDADFIARPELLERTMPHFDDERLAFVQLPQAFYNIDSIQHLAGADQGFAWHEQSMFYEVIQPGKNRWNAAFWCGSPAVLRRSALESVGGAATSTITEDILTSMRMHAAGWKSLYHNEILAVGVAPGDLDGFRTQRLRWAQGSMQILRSRENPLWKRGLSLPQRISYFASMSTYFQSLQLAVFVIMPLLILVTGQTPITNLGISFFARFVPYVAALLVANKLTGGRHERLGWDAYFSFLRMFTFLRALGTLATGGRRLRFRVTPKTPTATTHRRGLYPHIGVAAVNLGVITTALVGPLRTGLDTGTTIVVCLSAAFITTIYALTLARLWWRVYRRRDFRVPLTVPVLIGVDGQPEAIACTQDISFGGAAIFCPRPITPGSQLSVRLLGENHVQLEGIVVTCTQTGRDAHRAGIRFQAIAREDETRLLTLILEAAIGRNLIPERPAVDPAPSSAVHPGVVSAPQAA